MQFKIIDITENRGFNKKVEDKKIKQPPSPLLDL